MSPPQATALAAAEARLVLASASPSRARLLAAAGVACAIEPAGVDEEEMKRALKAEGAATEDAALALAGVKAQKVSRNHPGTLIIGADQILDHGGAWLDKPRDMAEAARHLARLSGSEHELVSAVVVLRDGVRLWHHVDRARLRMRTLSERFIADYLAAAGPAVLTSVGAYQLEGLGAQLFARTEGDFFTILGLPLLPLLDFLRQHGLVPE